MTDDQAERLLALLAQIAKTLEEIRQSTDDKSHFVTIAGVSEDPKIPDLRIRVIK